MPDSHGSTDFGPCCQRILVDRKVCYVQFGKKSVARSGDIGTTTRGEMMIADYDSDGHINGIELIGPGKPCQGT